MARSSSSAIALGFLLLSAPLTPTSVQASVTDTLSTVTLTATVTPNPLNPEAVLTVWTASSGPLRVTIHDPSGRLVRVLRDGPAEAGEHRVRIDGRGDGGAPLPTGVYFYRVESTAGETAGRFTILK